MQSHEHQLAHLQVIYTYIISILKNLLENSLLFFFSQLTTDKPEPKPRNESTVKSTEDNTASGTRPPQATQKKKIPPKPPQRRSSTVTAAEPQNETNAKSK